LLCISPQLVTVSFQIFRNFLNSFLESTLVGFVLVVLDLLLNSSHIPPEAPYSYF
jgi:hypothetical protein